MRSSLALLSFALAACAPPADPPIAHASLPAPAPAASSVARAAPRTPTVPPPGGPARPPRPEAAPLPYPWLAGDAPAGTLSDRFAPPEGFVRVDLAPHSFGAWLRGLPLAPPVTPVLSFQGRVILPADHENLAAVVAIDVGKQDLQQCADSVIRLHAEWLFALGRRDASYRAASGAPMPFARWARGERMVPEGSGFRWSASARPDAGHASYRRFLDAVFTWANTGSLARDTDPVALDDLRPGDFVVQPGAPGHAVLILDVARGPGGRRALLLGQGFMPAQSFHVLRPSGSTGPWFVVDVGGRAPQTPREEGFGLPAVGRTFEPGSVALDTPFWAPFPWKALRRFPAPEPAGVTGREPPPEP